MIKSKLIHFETRAQFDAKLKTGEISLRSIVLIKDTGELWTRNKFYAGTNHNHDGIYLPINGTAKAAEKLANINTTFSGKYPVTVNVNGIIYSHTGLQFEGSTGTLTATKFKGILEGKADDSAKLNGKPSTSYVRNEAGTSTSTTNFDANNIDHNSFKHDYRWNNIGNNGISSVLDLTYSPDWRTQLQFQHSASPTIYIRSRYNGTTWTGWGRLWTSFNFDPNTKANLASPSFTGTPIAPTAAAKTNTTQIATTAFVRKEVSDLVGGAPETLDTLKEIADYLTNGSIAGSIVDQLGKKVNKAGDTMTGHLFIKHGTNAVNSLNIPLRISAANAYTADSQNNSIGIGFAANGNEGNVKNAIGHVRTGGYDTGDIVFWLNSTVDAAVVNYTHEKFRFKNNGTFYAKGELYANADKKVWHAGNLVGNQTGHTHDQYYDSNATRTANTILAAPNGSNGKATFRALIAADLPSHGHNIDILYATDKRDVKPNTTGITNTIKAIKPFFTTTSTLGISNYGTDVDLLVLDTYSDSSGGNPNAIAFMKNTSTCEMFIGKSDFNGTSWGTFNRVWHSGNAGTTRYNWSAKSLILSGGISGATAIASTATLDINATNDIRLRAGARSLVLTSTYLKPYDVDHNTMSLGTSGARWSTIYGTSLNLNGTISGATTITSSGEIAALKNGRAASFGGTTLGTPNGTIANQTGFIQIMAGTGSASGSSGLIFHNPGISTAGLEYKNTDANNGYFNFKSDDTNWNLRVNNNEVWHRGNFDPFGLLAKTRYNVGSGFLIKTDIPEATSSMIIAEVELNTYGGKKTSIKLQWYDYTATDKYLNYSGWIIGDDRTVKVGRMDGKVVLWVSRTGNYQSCLAKLYRTTDSHDGRNRIISITDGTAPTDGQEISLHKVAIGNFLPITGGTLTGPLEISTGSINNAYNEGIRLTSATNGWVGITYGSTGLSGTPTNGWFSARNPSNQFIISPGSSDSTIGLTLNKGGDALWRNSKIWTAGNFTPGNYVLKAGDSMSGVLTLSGSATSTATGNAMMLAYSKLTCYGKLQLLANTDATSGDSEYVQIAAAVGNPTASTGVGFIVANTYAKANMRLDVNNGISVTSSNGGTWISGKTSTKGIVFPTQGTGSYHMALRTNSSSGNVLTYGGLGNDIGFYGYLASQTENSYNYHFVCNTSTGNWSTGQNISANAFVKNSSSNDYVLLGAGSHKQWTSSATASTLVERDGSGDINCRLLRSNYTDQSTISGGIVYRVNTTDNYFRICNSPSAIRTWLDAASSGHTHDLGSYSLALTLPDSSSSSTTFRTTIFGDAAYNHRLRIVRWNAVPTMYGGMSMYGTSINWAGGDTHGFMAIDYNTRNVRVGGGRGNALTWTDRVVLFGQNIGTGSTNYAAGNHGHPGLGTNGWGGISSKNTNGYINLGPANGSYAHIYTDRPIFYFNKDLLINGSTVWHSGNFNPNKITGNTIIAAASGQNSSSISLSIGDSDTGFHWNGDGNIILKANGVNVANYYNNSFDVYSRLKAGRIECGYEHNQANSIGCSNWFRSSGNTGWYSGSYGGGIYMSDSTWVRIFGSKKFYCDSTSTDAIKTAGGIWAGTGFFKNGSNNDHVLLGGGGHKNIGDFGINVSSGVQTGTGNSVNNDQFFAKLQEIGLFARSSSTTRGAWLWARAMNLETGVGNLNMAGTAVWSVSNSNDSNPYHKTCMFITQASEMFIYSHQEASYSGGWAKVWTSKNLNLQSVQFVRGMIMMWSGSAASVPSGWAICNGQNGTPNLTNRFIMGVSGSTAAGEVQPGATGGTNSKTLTLNEIPSHGHSVSVQAAGTLSGTTGSYSHSHRPEQTSWGFLGNQRFNTWPYTAGGGGDSNRKCIAKDYEAHFASTSTDSHTHTVSIPSHLHGVSQSNAGGGAAFDNRPAFYAMAFIMKL